jgi:hypothetical protein
LQNKLNRAFRLLNCLGSLSTGFFDTFLEFLKSAMETAAIPDFQQMVFLS